MVSIAVVDSDPDFIKIASATLQKAGFGVSVYSNLAGVSAIAGQFDCVICNVNGKQAGAYDLLRRIGGDRDKCSVVLVSRKNDVDLAMLAVRLGAADFLVKPLARKRLLTAVRNALRERDGRRAEASEEAELRERYMSLTERQRQTMLLLLRGCSNRDIAAKLSISARTVEIYRASVMAKMDAQSLVHLVRLGIRLGLE
ncbi:MAG: response regulator [Hyphomicrobiales bacterium]|nr:response regulator [Hyphomicrobiales bacterium]